MPNMRQLHQTEQNVTGPTIDPDDLTQITTEERKTFIVKRRRLGIPFDTIGTELGISGPYAHQLYWKAMAERKAPAVDQLRAEQNERLDRLHEKVTEVLNRHHVTVSGGKIVYEDIPVLDDHGQPVLDERGVPLTRPGKPLLDDAPVIKAAAELRQIEAERAKLNGTYAPVQATINGEIKFEILGVDMGTLS